MIHARITEVTVCALPESSINFDLFAVRVQWRGAETYAVLRHRQCLGNDGEWDFESSPSNREDEWIATHRFDYDTAYRKAIEIAPTVWSNGRTAAQVAAEEATDAH